MLQLPFRRRRSRWDRFRKTLEANRVLPRSTSVPERMRDSLPDPADLRRGLAPLMQRASAARPSLSLPDAPAFMQDWQMLDRIHLPGHAQPSRSERLLNANAPVWAVIAGMIGATVVGAIIGAMLIKREPGIPPEKLQAAAGQINGRWPAVRVEDIDEANGNLKRLAKLIGERTGEDARQVRERLNAMTANGAMTNGSGH